MKSSKMLVLVLSLTAGVALVWRFWNVAMPFFVAAIFAYLLGPLVNRLCRRGRMKRGLAVAIVLVVFVALIVLLLWWTIPYAINQVGSLVHDISSYASSLDELSDQWQVQRRFLPTMPRERAQALMEGWPPAWAFRRLLTMAW